MTRAALCPGASGGDDEFLVRVSHLEIYNEEVRDLLAKGQRSLEVHDTGDSSGVAVRGLSQFVVRNVSDIAHVLRVRS